MRPTLIWSLCSIILAATAAPHRRAPTGLKGKFLHVTDFHLDPHYLAGSDPAEFCHRAASGGQGGATAGKFGALGSKCDSPQALVDASFDFMKSNLQDVDFIIYTGDSARHNRDKTQLPRSQDEVIGNQKSIVDSFSKTYNLANIKLIPAIGNNDVLENNIVVGNDKQYTGIQDLWKPFGLNLTQEFHEGGYFVQDIVPGKLRTISMNTMLFLKKNAQVGDCDVDGPALRHMQWFKSVLDDSVAQHYRVFVLAHVPPSSKKDKAYYKPACQNLYYTLLGGYGDIIAGHFAGHFNNDMITAVLRSSPDSYAHLAALGTETPSVPGQGEAVTVLFNAPSIVPVNNPAIRIYQYETEGTQYPFGTIRDWTQYYANLEEANQSGRLQFQLEYQASQVYGVDHFDPAGVTQVFQQLAQNKDTMNKYTQFVTVGTNLPAANDEGNE